jgi:hypothetical protein
METLRAKTVRPRTNGVYVTYFGEPGGARTRDHRIKSAMLYQLSYRPILLTTN